MSIAIYSPSKRHSIDKGVYISKGSLFEEETASTWPMQRAREGEKEIGGDGEVGEIDCV